MTLTLYHIDANFFGVAGRILGPAVMWMMEQRNAWAHSHRTSSGEAIWKYEQVRNTFVMARDLLRALNDPLMETNLQQLADNFETHKRYREARIAAMGEAGDTVADQGANFAAAAPPANDFCCDDPALRPLPPLDAAATDELSTTRTDCDLE